jgi:hypothetical protein
MIPVRIPVQLLFSSEQSVQFFNFSAAVLCFLKTSFHHHSCQQSQKTRTFFSLNVTIVTPRTVLFIFREVVLAENQLASQEGLCSMD